MKLLEEKIKIRNKIINILRKTSVEPEKINNKLKEVKNE